MHYEFYIDAYIVTNFFFDYLTLFLIREVRRKQTKTGRMAVMALLGVLSAAASMLLLKNAGIYKILVHLLINPLMFYFCFQQKSIREFLTDYASGISDHAVAWRFGRVALPALRTKESLWMGYGRHSRSGDYIFTPVSGPEGGRKNL